MQATPIYSVSNGYFTLEQKTLSPENKNNVYKITALGSEYIKNLASLPFAEVFQLPKNDYTFHLIIDPQAQKLIQSFHRYGPKVKDEEKFCPFGKGKVQRGYERLLGKENLFTVFSEIGHFQCHAILSYFNDDKLQSLQNACLSHTENWIETQIKQSPVYLFDACHYLVAEFLIKHVFQFDTCTPDDIYCTKEFWKNILAHHPADLKSVAEFENPENIGFFHEFYKECVDIYKEGKPNTKIDSKEIDSLVLSIYESTLSKDGSFVDHLTQCLMKRDEILQNIKGLLLAGCEPTGNFFGFLLYEYAKQPDLQTLHFEEPERIVNGYLEALRLYSVRGSVREADVDIVLSHFDKMGNKKEHFIRAGDRIQTSPMLAGHSPESWKDAEEFNPERENLNLVKKTPHYGSGENGCIGEKIAEMHILNSLDEVISNTFLTVDRNVELVVGKYSLRPKDDVLIHFYQRK